MAKRTCVIVPVDDSVLITENTRGICAAFTEIIKQSGGCTQFSQYHSINFEDLPVFDEFTGARTGFWKRLTIRDFSGDCMIVVTVHPCEEEEKVRRAKENILNAFIKFGNITDPLEFNVRSVFWHLQENASDMGTFEHIGGSFIARSSNFSCLGTPYVYETILGVRFRISPHTFFQTNSRGASLLYSVIGDFLGLPNTDSSKQTEDVRRKQVYRVSHKLLSP